MKAAAACGAVRAGDPLPGIHPLAEELRVNRNTVAKAYAELESQGVRTTADYRSLFGIGTAAGGRASQMWLRTGLVVSLGAR